MKEKRTTQAKQLTLMERFALTPYSVWALLFILVPLVFVAYYAFTDSNFAFTFDNITKFFTATSTVTGDDGAAREVRTYLLIFWRSLKLAVVSTIICLLIGYPVAYIMSRAKPRAQKTMMTLIMRSLIGTRSDIQKHKHK